MKNLILIIVFLMSGTWFDIYAQNIIKDTSNVNKPKEGTLYYQKKDKTMYLYRKGFELFENTVSTPTDPIEPPIIIPTDPTKISIPVGLIMWDNWRKDYWNEPNPPYDILINHISKSRYVATYFKNQFDLVPFYGSWNAPEKVKIRYNVKWNQELGQNTYDEVEKFVEVKYDKTSADTEREIKYYRDAGFDFLCINYYNDGSYLSETRKHFVNMPDKLGMKMTFMLETTPNDSEIGYITDLMTKDYWFKISGKSVLYLKNSDYYLLPKFQESLRNKGGGEIYVVYYDYNGYPGDWSDYQSKNPSAISAYNTTIGGVSTAEDGIKKEVSDRENWIGQFRATNINLIPILSLGLENLEKRTDLGSNNEPVGIIGASNDEQVSRKFDLIKPFIKKYPEKIPAVLWYAANEINEAGRSFVPKKLKNGTIDKSLLDIASKHLN